MTRPFTRGTGRASAGLWCWTCVLLVLVGCQGRGPDAFSHACVVTPNNLVECSDRNSTADQEGLAE